MSERVLTEPISVEKEASKVAPGSQVRRSSKAFNSFQIAQAQFDKVAAYLGLDAGRALTFRTKKRTIVGRNIHTFRATILLV